MNVFCLHNFTTAAPIPGQNASHLCMMSWIYMHYAHWHFYYVHTESLKALTISPYLHQGKLSSMIIYSLYIHSFMGIPPFNLCFAYTTAAPNPGLITLILMWVAMTLHALRSLALCFACILECSLSSDKDSFFRNCIYLFHSMCISIISNIHISIIPVHVHVRSFKSTLLILSVTR